MHDQQYKSPHRFRFYLVLTTLVVGVILFLLLMNDSNGSLNITTSAVRDIVGQRSNGGSVDAAVGESDSTIEEDSTSLFGKTVPGKEVDFKLSFNEIPIMKKDAKIDQMELTFTDFNRKISINSDQLELGNLEKANLKISGFVGKLNLNEGGLSLNGNAKKIDVNGVTLSSKGIEMSFSNLNFDTLIIDSFEVKEGVLLSSGDGTLTVGNKLNYALEQDTVKLAYFNGKLDITTENGVSTNMEGIAKGIDVGGSLLNMNLR